VYEGMIVARIRVRRHRRQICKEKKLTNIRAAARTRRSGWSRPGSSPSRRPSSSSTRTSWWRSPPRRSACEKILDAGSGPTQGVTRRPIISSSESRTVVIMADIPIKGAYDAESAKPRRKRKRRKRPHPRAPVREDRDALLHPVRAESDRRFREARLRAPGRHERKHHEDILAIAKKMGRAASSRRLRREQRGAHAPLQAEYSRIREEKRSRGRRGGDAEALGSSRGAGDVHPHVENSSNRQEKTFFKLLASEEQSISTSSTNTSISSKTPGCGCRSRATRKPSP